MSMLRISDQLKFLLDWPVMAKAVFPCEKTEEENAIKRNESRDLRFIARSFKVTMILAQ